MGLSIVDLIPSLGRYVARNRAGAEQAGLDQSRSAIQGLMGQAPTSFEDFGANGMGFDQAQEGSGLMADPTNAGNQLRFGQGLMGTAGYGQAGQQFMNSALSQQLGLPMDQARLGLDVAKYNRGTSTMQNINQALNNPDPAVRQMMSDYLAKTDSTTINMPSQAQAVAGGWAAESAQTGIAVDDQLGTGFTPSYMDEQLWKLPFGIGNQTASDEYQKYRTNSNAWIQANLRPESGAAIPVEELEGYFQTYMPQAGNSEEVIEAKRLLRAQKQQSRLAAAGKAQTEILAADDLPASTRAQPEAQPAGAASTKVYALPDDAQPVSTRQDLIRSRSRQIEQAGER